MRDMSQIISIRHNTFAESRGYRLLQWKAHALREKNREKIRERAEAFINEIGVENVVSIAEHGSLFRPFSVVVWYKEAVEEQVLVTRATQGNR
jgi:hypothetical protein